MVTGCDGTLIEDGDRGVGVHSKNHFINNIQSLRGDPWGHDRNDLYHQHGIYEDIIYSPYY